MSAPTKVTVRIITNDSGSIRRSTFAANVPEWTQSHRCATNPPRPLDGFWMKPTNVFSASTNDPATVTTPSHPTHHARHRLPVSRRMAAPARGSAGISATRTVDGRCEDPAPTAAIIPVIRLPLQQAGVVDVGAPPLPVQGYEDAQADHHLRRRH